MMNQSDKKPKIPTEKDRKRQMVEQVVKQKEALYRQRAMGTLQNLQAMAANMDLENNPHLARLMVNAAYGVKHSTEVLTDMARDELWTRLGLYDTNEDGSANDVVEIETTHIEDDVDSQKF